MSHRTRTSRGVVPRTRPCFGKLPTPRAPSCECLAKAPEGTRTAICPLVCPSLPSQTGKPQDSLLCFSHQIALLLRRFIQWPYQGLPCPRERSPDGLSPPPWPWQVPFPSSSGFLYHLFHVWFTKDVVLFHVDAKKRRRDRGGLGPRNTRREKREINSGYGEYRNDLY